MKIQELDFLRTCKQDFNLGWLKPNCHTPITLSELGNPFYDDELWGCQKLHYLIKPRVEDKYYISELVDEIPAIERFIFRCDNYLRSSFLQGLITGRYAYLTVDTRPVKKGETQRAPGWHIDCVQGDEVPVKKGGNIAFSWCDALPTEYAAQAFDMEGCDLSKHNVFEWVGSQVKPENIKEIGRGVITLMNTYCVHRCKVADTDRVRRYVRLSYTHVPITNNKLHINPEVPYDYPVHSTTGQIPEHLT